MDRSLHGWAEMFDKIQMAERRGGYDTNICGDFERIERFGLPTYNRLLLEPEKFINELKIYEQSFKFPAYYAQVYPQAMGIKKFNLMNFSQLSDLIPFLKQNIEKYMDRYLLLVSEFEENIYGGSAMSDGSRVVIDLVKGLQNQISYGNGALYSCTANENGISALSGIDDDKVIYLFEEVLDSLTILSSSKRQCYLKGYFEFAFTRSTGNSQLRLVFFDYKADARFYV